MQITTGEIKMTPNLLFGIAIRRHFEEKKWLMVAYPVGLFGYLFLMNVATNYARYLGIIGFGLMLAVLLYVLTYYWQHTHSGDNASFFLSRFYEFDRFFIRTKVEDGSQGSYRWDSIVKLTETASYYLLYTTRTKFMYIAKSAFKTQGDLQSFNYLLMEKGLMVK